MKVIAINGSPRKQGNTSILLQKSLEGAKSTGADIEIINLYDLNYKGCSSCFMCKRKNSKFIAHCAIKDGLSETLEKVISSNVLILGSPIYLGDITGLMRSFLERLLFMNLSYNANEMSYFKGKISVGFIYTMGIPESLFFSSNYQYNFDSHMHYLKLLNGDTEFMISFDSYQFDDYSKYNASKFDENHKKEVKKIQFPIDCETAFKLGERLALNSKSL